MGLIACLCPFRLLRVTERSSRPMLQASQSSGDTCNMPKGHTQGSLLAAALYSQLDWNFNFQRSKCRVSRNVHTKRITIRQHGVNTEHVQIKRLWSLESSSLAGGHMVHHACSLHRRQCLVKADRHWLACWKPHTPEDPVKFDFNQKPVYGMSDGNAYMTNSICRS